MNRENHRAVRKTVYILLAVVSIVFGITFNKYMKMAHLSNDQLQKMGVVIFETPKSFTMTGLINHHGQPFTLENLKDRWTLVYFGFTFCPDVCPLTLSQLNKLDTLLKNKSPTVANKIQYVMVSVDPNRDTAEQLTKYISSFNQDFVGVTGDISGIYNLATQLNVPFTPVIDTDDEFYLVDHGANIMLINPKGHHHGFITFPINPEQIFVVLKSLI